MNHSVDEALQTALDHHRGGRFADAEAAYRAVLALDARHAAANHNLGVVLLVGNQPAAALGHLVTALEADPATATHWLSLIECLIRLQQWGEAMNLIGTAESHGLTDPALTALKERCAAGQAATAEQELLGHLQAMTGGAAAKGKDEARTVKSLSTLFAAQRYADMAAQAQAALQAFPMTGKFWHLLALALLQQGQHAGAAYAFERATSLCPTDAEVWAHAGHGCAARGDADGAARAFARSLALAPNNAEVRKLAADQALAAGRLDEAESHFRRALVANPHAADAHNGLGRVLHLRGKFDEAASHYGKALARNPRLVAALSNLGSLHAQLGRSAEANDCFERALALDGEAWETHANFGSALIDAGDLERGVAHCERALALNPVCVGAQVNLGNACRARGDFAAADARYRRALELQADCEDAHINRIALLIATGQCAAAVAHAQAAVTARPEAPRLLASLAAARHEAGEHEAALAAYERALASAPTNADWHAGVASVYYALGRYGDAATHARRALELAGVSDVACGILGRALIRQKAYAEAAAVLQPAATQPGAVASALGLSELHHAQGRIADALAALDVAGGQMLADGQHHLSLANDWLAALVQTPDGRSRLGPLVERLVAGAAGLPRYQGVVDTYAMLSAWITGDLDALRRSVERSVAYAQMMPTAADRNAMVFHRLLGRLLAYRATHGELYDGPGGRPLVVIGESHSLAPVQARFDWCGERHVGCSGFVMGVKMFHLANAEPNKYKAHVRDRLRAAPADASLLMTIGEIDTRVSEGIWSECRKGRQSIEALIAETVDGYLDWLVVALGERDPARVTIQGIPAPSLPFHDGADPGDMLGYLAMIRAVDARLRAGARQRGWHFLDVYGAMARDDGSSHGQWNIDSRHLVPGFYAAAAPWLA